MLKGLSPSLPNPASVTSDDKRTYRGIHRRGVGTGRIGELLPGASARADMYRRLGRTAEARASYEKALALTQQEPERQFLQERIRQLK